MEKTHKGLNILVIIPARGGSKSIPRKNIHLLAGKPLIAHTIEHASRARYINRIVVSTDDSEIASISKKYGAEIVLRPAELSTDVASSELALLHVLEFLEINEEYEPDAVVFLAMHFTVNITPGHRWDYSDFLDEHADSALTVVPFHGFLWKKNVQGKVIGINHNKSVRIRRQDLKTQYQETGAVYVMKTKGFLKAKNRFFGKVAVHVIPLENSLEINELVDFHIAEALFREKKYKS